MIKNTKDKKKSILIILCISIVAVILIPMLYSSIYLSAFWDTYGKINNVPVAFVNLDKPVTKGDKSYNIGKDVEDKLRDNDKVKWSFVSLDEAKKGVEGTDYYAMIVIPADFSQKLADSSDGRFEKTEVIYEGNKGKNYVFYQISEKVAQSIKSDIASSIQEETSKALVDNLYDIKSSLNEASDGANKLQKGTQELTDGSHTLKIGMLNAFDGSKLLQNGLKKATTGQKDLSNGTDSLIAGLNQLRSGLSQKNENIEKLVNGANETAKGAKNLADGAALAYEKSSVAKNDLSNKSKYAAGQITDVSNKVDNADDLLSSILADFQANGGKLSEQSIKNLNKAKDLTKEVRDKNIKTNLAGQLENSGDSLDPLIEKLSLLKDGSTKVKAGTSQVSDGTNQLVSGISQSMDKAVVGTDKLINGVEELKKGSQKLYTGLDNATNKTGDLSTGLSKLNDGSIALNNGLNTANDGTSKLKDGLSDGYNKMNDNLKFTSTDMSKFVSEPVSLKETTLNDVPYYGEGLAPYFVSLSLWLGGMFINLVLSIAKKVKVTDNKFAKSFTGKFIIGAAMAIIQALLVSFVLVNGLKIDTVGTGYFYLNNIFISLVFFSIMYGVSYALGIIGTPIMFIVFLLQLASAGGTFPIETAPVFFRVIGEYLPFTYSVGMLRMVIGGINISLYQSDVSILLVFMGTFLFGGYIIKAVINSIKNIKVNVKENKLQTV